MDEIDNIKIIECRVGQGMTLASVAIAMNRQGYKIYGNYSANIDNKYIYLDEEVFVKDYLEIIQNDRKI